MSEGPHPPTRRTILDWVIGLCSAISGMAMTIPALLYLWPAARGGATKSVELEGADNMALGASRTIQVGGKAVIVVRHRAGFTALSAICTHLGCLVKWSASQNEFLCPCHAGVFDANGQVVSGPPPAPLPKYAVKEVGGKVYISAA